MTPSELEQKINDDLEAMMGIEGDFVDDPNDSGGATRWGVTERIARAFGYPGEMRYLPRDRAKEILRQLCYTGPGFHRIAEINPRIASELFEIEVNLPPGKAASFLQRALTALNDPKGTGRSEDLLYPDLKPDGVAGGVTREALHKFLRFRGRSGETVLLRLINSQQAVHYLTRTEERPKNERFLFGWVLHRISIE